MLAAALAGAALSAISVPVATSAAGHSAPRDTLGVATVVALRPAAALHSAAPVQRLDTTAMRRRGITDIGDALRRFAGVNLRDYGGAGGLKSVSVRGLGASHTAVFYDGLPVSDAQGGQIDLGRFSTDRLAAIGVEVADAAPLLTPVSSLAAAKVTLTAVSPDTVRRRLMAALRGGAFTTLNPALRASAPLGHGMALGAAADFYFGENDYPYTVANGVATERRHRRNSRMQATTAEADFTADNRYGRWAAKAYYYNNHRRLPGIVRLYTDEGHERLAEQNALGQAHWQRDAGRLSLMGAAKFSFSESRYTDTGGQYPGGRLAQYYWQREWYATAGAAYDFKAISLAYAADVRHSAINSNVYGTGRPQRTAILQSVSARYALGPVLLTARCAAHIYSNRRTGGDAAADATRLTPMATAIWTPVDRQRCRLALRAFYQELFRVPTFTESYYYHLGSQTLRPELTRQLGIGTTLLWQPGTDWARQVAVTLDGYANRVTDRIVSVPYNLFVWRTVNLATVEAHGIDATLEARFTPAARHMLLLSANYSWQRVADRSMPGSIGYGNQLAYTPLHSGAASLSWENPLCGLSVHTTAASPRWSSTEHLATTRMPGYAETGAGIYRTLALRRSSLALRADVLNLFNRSYAIVRRYPMPGRAWRLSLRYGF